MEVADSPFGFANGRFGEPPLVYRQYFPFHPHKFAPYTPCSGGCAVQIMALTGPSKYTTDDVCVVGASEIPGDFKEPHSLRRALARSAQTDENAYTSWSSSGAVSQDDILRYRRRRAVL